MQRWRHHGLPAGRAHLQQRLAVFPVATGGREYPDLLRWGVALIEPVRVRGTRTAKSRRGRRQYAGRQAPRLRAVEIEIDETAGRLTEQQADVSGPPRIIAGSNLRPVLVDRLLAARFQWDGFP